MIRKVCGMVFCLGLALFVIWIYFDGKIVANPFLADFYIEHFVKDTWAGNGVAAIYLNYRVFDSIFETLMLLISVTAVINFSWRKDSDR